MAETIVFNIAENVLGKLTSFAFQQISLAWGLESDLEKIKEMLLAISAVLLDAEQKQARDQRIQFWLEQLQEVLYDAEDVLDEVEYEALRRQVLKSGSTRRKVRRFFSRSNPLVFRFRIACELKNIRERVAEVAALKSTFGLTEGVNDRKIVHNERKMTHSFVDPKNVFGRDADKENIIPHLLNVVDGENVSILPIVGMGGLGKTTLAKLVYNDERVTSHFEEKVWVCVSDEFDLQKVLIKIIKSATDEKCTDWDVEQLQRFLRNTLNNKKYLLILDDVWNEDPRKWSELKDLLIASAAIGSRIIVTTRSHHVALIMGSVPPYNLTELSYEDCMSLFYKCAFKDRQVEQYPNLVQIGREIVRKCKGVPLAVTTLGNLLYSVTNEHDWESIRDSEIWRLNQNENDIMPALRISYEHLPSYLKKCFAYSSFFPKDYVYREFELIQFWMAQGLLQSNNDSEELEDVGLRYIKELYSRSFFQDFEQVFGGIKCKMHDLIHDLASSLTKKECSIITSTTQQISKSVRHLLFADPTSLPNCLPLNLRGLDHVRSVTSYSDDQNNFHSESIIQLCSRFQYLRWLDLKNLESETLPEIIGKLRHLRFLNLNDAKIKRLPNSLYKLHNLQTLWFWDCEIEEVPSYIRYLINLRSLSITTKQKHLPNNGIGCLKCLHCLIISDCQNLEYLFEDMEGLTNLQQLVILACSNLICLPQSTKHLTALKALLIGGCENLNLKMEEEKESQDFNQLSLQSLFLLGLPKLQDLPEWLLQGSTTTLQFLQLAGCENLKELPVYLKKLTSLQELQIENCVELKERCKHETGEDWSKIAHIPKIVIDSGSIQSTNDD